MDNSSEQTKLAVVVALWVRARTLRNQTQILLSDNPPVSAVPALRKSRHFSKVSPAFLGILKFQL